MVDTVMRILRLGARGYSCSQILLAMALEDRGAENPDLVRAMAGLAYGCGGGRATCGALTGGCCLLALYAGKGADSETASERLPLMLQELAEAFAARQSAPDAGLTCEALVGEQGPAASLHDCGKRVADTYALTMDILIRNGFDPFGGQ